MATMSALLTVLGNNYSSVGTPLEANGGAVDEHNVKEYVVNVLEEGSTRENSPYFIRHNIVIAVKDEGDPGESAGFKTPELPKQTQRSLVTGSGLADISRIYSDPEMRNRVQSAIGKASSDIMYESGATANHAERLAWAMDALTVGRDYIEMFMRFVSLNATVQANGGSATDNDLQYIVNSHIDIIATTLFGA